MEQDIKECYNGRLPGSDGHLQCFELILSQC
jgi:hypothetical protein